MVQQSSAPLVLLAGGAGSYINWKRMFARSSAAAGSERSIAVSMSRNTKITGVLSIRRFGELDT